MERFRVKTRPGRGVTRMLYDIYDGDTRIEILRSAQDAAQRVAWLNAHAEEYDRRHAEKQTIAQADAARQAELDAAAAARRNRLAQLEAERGPLATHKQVDYILNLLAGRGGQPMAEGGFVRGPTTRGEIEEMPRAAASAYIDSLNGNY